MKANTLRHEPDTNNSANDRTLGWDAFSVWHQHVRNAPVAASAAVPSEGWDPYLVWLTRVKKG